MTTFLIVSLDTMLKTLIISWKVPIPEGRHHGCTNQRGTFLYRYNFINHLFQLVWFDGRVQTPEFTTGLSNPNETLLSFPELEDTFILQNGKAACPKAQEASFSRSLQVGLHVHLDLSFVTHEIAKLFLHILH